MKKILLSALVLLAAMLPQNALAWIVPSETLSYEVHYRWGLINANAGVATVQSELLPGKNLFRARLSGQSVCLLGHYYGASDMLVGTIMADTYQPVYNQKITEESGAFNIETVVYNHNADCAEGEVIKTLPNGQQVKSRISHYAGGVTIDLLAVFYYMRQLDYQNMQPGQSVRINVFYDKTPEVLTINYVGKETIDFKGQQHEVFHITMNFTGQNGGTEVSDAMSALISTSDSRIPLVVNGNLKFGHVHCTLVSAE